MTAVMEPRSRKKPKHCGHKRDLYRRCRSCKADFWVIIHMQNTNRWADEMSAEEQYQLWLERLDYPEPPRGEMYPE